MEDVVINILGDICPDIQYLKLFGTNRIECTTFGDVLPVLQKSDLTIANLECPATERKTPIIKCGSNLKTNPETLNILKQAGISALTLANNHILDFGEEGVVETIENSNKLSILTYGAENNQAEASKPIFVSCKGRRIGMLAFAEEEFNCATKNTAGANLFDPYTSLKDVERAKKQCDYLIINYH